MMKNKTRTMDELKSMYPCHEGLIWVQTQVNLKAAWTNCKRGDWMLWYFRKICGKINSPSHRKFTACKCACARLALHLFESKYPKDNRPRRAIEFAESYARGKKWNDESASSSSDAAASSSSDAAASAASDAYASARIKILAQCAEEIRKICPRLP